MIHICVVLNTSLLHLRILLKILVSLELVLLELILLIIVMIIIIIRHVIDSTLSDGLHGRRLTLLRGRYFVGIDMVVDYAPVLALLVDT